MTVGLGLILKPEDIPTNGDFFAQVLRPFLDGLNEHRHRFAAPPLASITGYIDVQSTRWVPSSAPPEIEYYVAADRGGLVPAMTPSTNGFRPPRLIKAWAKCPVDVPAAMKMLAKPITAEEIQ